MNQPVDPHEVFARYFTGCEALAYALSSKLAEGNICVDIEQYKAELAASDTSAAFPVSAEVFEEQCNHPGFVTRDANTPRPFVIYNNKAYLHRYFTYETQVAGNIRRLNGKFHIITGGPGSGKTYSVSLRLADLFARNPAVKVALAAPTGKAAARMNESVRKFAETMDNTDETIRQKLAALKAQTIHRLLGYIPDSVFFRHDREHPLPYDVVITDECSMIDGALMAKLLNAVGDNTDIFLLGDKDQLASVEAGSVFGDICRAAASELLQGKVELKTGTRRFDPHKGIGRFSAAVIAGNLTVEDFAGDEQIHFETLPDNDADNFNIAGTASFRKYALMYADYIREPDIKKALQYLNRVRFLCVTRQNGYSVNETNRHIEKILKQHLAGEGIFSPAPGFYHNQPVIITQNDYTLDIFNGDTGIIRREDNAGSDMLYAFFESPGGEVRKIPAGYLSHYETVFAMTVHKSQGSEFEHVAVILPGKTGQQLLTRELLYTAVTRARQSAIIFSANHSLERCIRQTVSRASGLYGRLMNGNL